jgi:hypothetical protein
VKKADNMGVNKYSINCRLPESAREVRAPEDQIQCIASSQQENKEVESIARATESSMTMATSAIDSKR